MVNDIGYKKKNNSLSKQTYLPICKIFKDIFLSGTNSCKWLLSDGRYKGDQEWQPYGCMLHRYTKIDTRKCLRYLAFYGTKTHFIFVGDKRIQDLYMTFVNHLKQEEEVMLIPLQDVTKNLTHIDNKLKLKVEFFGISFVSKLMVDKFR
jgi:hypothetical protein